jgi:geranylgeranyl diphosphate synthase type II
MIEKYSGIIRNELDSIWPELPEPKSLYEPILYTLEAGGKRMRPVLLLAACDYFGGNLYQASKAACAVELFHNFTLLHDDIMDNAEMRRGRQTVYKRNGLNTAILSGDLLMIKVYQLLAQTPAGFLSSVLETFNQMGVRVCEGQQMDAEFEQRSDVSIDEYLRMIEYKTAVLPAAAMKMGAQLAGADEKEAEKLYRFGTEIGLAFQIKDDWLDVFGNPEETGKVKAGDLIAGKKSLPVLLTLDCLEQQDKASFLDLLHSDSPDKVNRLLAIMQEWDISGVTLQWADKYFRMALKTLDSIEGDDSRKNFFRAFADSLMVRRN